MESETIAPPRVAIVGPTAAGKTAVGMALAKLLDTEIVSADSMQVYRRMDIGTAKPTAHEQTQAVFHGLDVADPNAPWTLADFQELGNKVCVALAVQNRYPLVVGGTGLYVRALTTALDIPHTPPDEEFRAQWRTIAREHGTAFVQTELDRIDPESAARIHVNDLGRLIRALEVYKATGITLSVWHQRNAQQAAAVPVRLFGLYFADRRCLYERIEARVDQMLADGFVDEVRALLAAGYGRALKPMQSLGYRHLAAFLAGEATLNEAVEQTKRDTRHFARRQLIWFRADPRIQWIDITDLSAGHIASQIAASLETSDALQKDMSTDE